MLYRIIISPNVAVLWPHTWAQLEAECGRGSILSAQFKEAFFSLRLSYGALSSARTKQILGSSECLQATDELTRLHTGAAYLQATLSATWAQNYFWTIQL